MPRRATKFREDWLTLIDGNNAKISKWCVKGRDDFSAYCFLCKSTANISNSGQVQLMQHASSAKHQKLHRPLKDSSQSRFVISGGNKSLHLNTKKKNSDQLPWTLNKEEKLCRTEILWVLHLVINNYSFNSCESVKELFCEMFPESPVPKVIQMRDQKEFIFSINKRMLTSERASMNIDTIRGLRLIKDAVERKATNMKITQEMIQFYKEAYSKYKAQKDSENEAKQKKKKEKKNPPEKKPCNKLVTIKDDISSAQSMIDEGNKRLQTGLKRKSMKEIEAAQALIEAGNKRLKVASDEIHKT